MSEDAHKGEDKDGATMLRDSRPVDDAEENGEIQYDIGANDDVHDSSDDDEEDEEYDDDEDTAAPQALLVHHSQLPNCPSPSTLLLSHTSRPFRGDAVRAKGSTSHERKN
jgi:hypothetical protein